jgi:hypothetical protein
MVVFDDLLSILVIFILLLKHFYLLLEQSYFYTHVIALLSGLQFSCLTLTLHVTASAHDKIITTAPMVPHLSLTVAVTI